MPDPEGVSPADPRADLVDLLAGVVAWHLEPIAESDMDRRRVDDWPVDEQAAYRAAPDLMAAWAVVQAIRRRKVADAIVGRLAVGDLPLVLLNPGDLQGSVGVVLGQLREARGELQACREAMALQVAMRQSAEEELQVTRSTVRTLADQVTALVEGRVVDAGEQVRELADRCAVMRVGLLRLADDIEAGHRVGPARVRKLAGS